MLIATINGHFDLAEYLLDQGANPNLAQHNGVTPMYAALNCQWAAKALYPQPRAYEQQHTSYLDLIRALLDKGADPNARLTKKVWYHTVQFDQSGVDEAGATAFWRAAYSSDIDAMKLLIARGADPNIPTMRMPGRVRTGDVGEREGRNPQSPRSRSADRAWRRCSRPRRGLRRGLRRQPSPLRARRDAGGGEVLVEELRADVNAGITKATRRSTMPPPAATTR